MSIDRLFALHDITQPNKQIGFTMQVFAAIMTQIVHVLNRSIED